MSIIYIPGTCESAHLLYLGLYPAKNLLRKKSDVSAVCVGGSRLGSSQAIVFIFWSSGSVSMREVGVKLHSARCGGGRRSGGRCEV